ncbi:hypothetical protein C5Y96_02255 [Blastopirellula marina]|uniref:Uncharacterized protein n=1 Tax=Blastopirellula marina TaxID=124 RepID=A0A2S8G3K2_9BACT|nr:MULTISPECIES: hypothetical protein [Pirellulaceae]PQO38724.1 hypothetical protein C5Y96_02255 [Blastopirellula marina]RCS55032.1 hypothetical protein DTL36_02260 [Bremerella cremea]
MVPLLLACAWLGLVPSDPAILDQVDLVEVNHVYDSSGHPVLDQVIFYQWSHVDARYQVVAWRLLRSPGQVPRRVWNQRVYVARWFDAEMLRNVIAGQYRETWTTYDPEMAERAIYPIEYRRELATRMPRGTQSLSLR